MFKSTIYLSLILSVTSAFAAGAVRRGGTMRIGTAEGFSESMIRPDPEGEPLTKEQVSFLIEKQLAFTGQRSAFTRTYNRDGVDSVSVVVKSRKLENSLKWSVRMNLEEIPDYLIGKFLRVVGNDLKEDFDRRIEIQAARTSEDEVRTMNARKFDVYFDTRGGANSAEEAAIIFSALDQILLHRLNGSVVAKDKLDAYLPGANEGITF